MRFTGKDAILFLFINVLHVHSLIVLKTQNVNETEILHLLNEYQWSSKILRLLKENQWSACYCGENGICSIENDVQKCKCNDNFAENDGVCLPCNCGKNGKCSFVNGRRTCVCEDLYKEDDGICKECDCGSHGECSLETGIKMCTCDLNYALKNGKCEYIQGCGRVFTNPTGIISSPNYPFAYTANLKCEWLIRMHPDNRLKLTFETFMLEHQSNCYFDFLEVYSGNSDSAPLLGRYCGQEPPPDIFSNTNQLFIRFRSDNSVQYNGFKAEYKTILESTTLEVYPTSTPAVRLSTTQYIQGCGGVFTTPTGRISSPNYPDVYPANLNCEWLIRILPDNRLKLTFETFMLEHQRNCPFDYLEIYSGNSDRAPLLGRYCGQKPPPDILSDTNQLFIRFTSDSSLHYNGFKAEYKTILESTTLEVSPTSRTTVFPLSTQYCNCGIYSKSCRSKWNGEKICDCFRGYARNHGTCEECNCGRNSKSCHFDWNGDKACDCNYGYAHASGTCVECDCGKRAKSCYFDWTGDKICKCTYGYTQISGVCVDKTGCDCGRNATFCHLNWKNEKVCNCNDGYSQVFGICKECNCGVNAKSCFFNEDGFKVCNCDIGHIQSNGYCAAICNEDKCIHGECEIVERGFKCRCNEGYAGQRCEEKVATESSKQNLWMVLQLSVGFATFILLSAMVCYLTRILHKLSKK